MTEKDIAVPVATSDDVDVVPLHAITRVAMFQRALVVSYGENQVRIAPGHFANKASFERFLAQFQAALDAAHRPADSVAPPAVTEP